MFERIKRSLEARGYWEEEAGEDVGDVGDGGQDADDVSEGAAQATWPSDWRTQLAGEDEKTLKQLERYASPKDIWNKAKALEQKLSSGEYRPNVPFPKDGTDEEKLNWRKTNGLPESAEAYDLTFDNGLVIGDEDKPIIDEFLKSAYDANMPPDQVKHAVSWYYDLQERQAAEREQNDAAIKAKAEDELRSEWGNDYRRNINLINGLLDTAPEGVKDKFLGGRMADGTPIASDPEMLRFLIDVSRQINPPTTLVPGAGANISSAIDDEIDKLEGMMRDRNSEYWKGPTSQKNQNRYRDLVEARDKMKKAG